MTDYNTVLRIYSTFAEVRENYDVPKEFTTIFNLQDYHEIIEDSIELEGVNVKACSIETKESNLEGQTVYIREKEKTTAPRKVTFVRGRDMLVRDEETGRFFTCGNAVIEYTSIPIETLNEIKFWLDNSGKATLVYLYRAIIWYPKYRLDFEDEKSTLKGIAVIKNNSDRDFHVRAAELIGGDVTVEYVSHRPLYMEDEMLCETYTSERSAAAPAVSEGTETGGLFNYEIDKNFHLKGKSQILLPFLNPKIDVSSYSSATNTSNSNQVQKFNRMLELCSSEYLPGGKLSIRENGRLIGFKNLDALSMKEKREILIGKDASAFYDRKTKLLKRDNNSTISEITLTLHNEHSKPWMLKYEEIINIYQKKITFEAISDGIELTEHGLKITSEMEKQSNKTFKYKITEIDMKEHKDNQLR